MQAVTVVVGAAILRGTGDDAQILAAQRKTPAALAGLWEFVGGKVEPGESDADALRRECREELGVEIVVGDRVGGDVDITGGGATLRVWTARIADGVPVSAEHQCLRWLGRNELYVVEWLPADLPVVAALAARLVSLADPGDQ